jgi:hypothetical protein
MEYLFADMGNAIMRQPVDAGVPQGSPMSQILCARFASALIKWVAERVYRVEGLFFDLVVKFGMTVCNVNDVVRTLQACARVSIYCTDSWERELDTIAAKVALITCR